MGCAEPLPCRVFRPSKAEFSEPFCNFVRRVFRENEDISMFKVVPPVEWHPRVTPYPSLDEIVISCPIRQHVILHLPYSNAVPDGTPRRLESKEPTDVTWWSIR